MTLSEDHFNTIIDRKVCVHVFHCSLGCQSTSNWPRRNRTNFAVAKKKKKKKNDVTQSDADTRRRVDIVRALRQGELATLVNI
jgi:hypothetical protein